MVTSLPTKKGAMATPMRFMAQKPNSKILKLSSMSKTLKVKFIVKRLLMKPLNIQMKELLSRTTTLIPLPNKMQTSSPMLSILKSGTGLLSQGFISTKLKHVSQHKVKKSPPIFME